MSTAIEEFSGIYAIIHIASGRCYVGQAVKVERRWRQHKCELRAGRHHSRYLQRSWDKNGEDAFAFVLLERSSQNLTVLEQSWASRLNSVFNSRLSVDSNFGMKRSPESKQRMSAANHGRVTSEATKQKLRDAFTGKKYGESTSEKHRKWHREVGFSLEARTKMSESAFLRESSRRAARLIAASDSAGR